MKLIKNADCVNAPDSMHMTSLTETPLVALMGNALQSTYGPTRIGNRTIILNKSSECSPCSRTSYTKYNGLSCVQAIGALEIIKSVRSMISK